MVKHVGFKKARARRLRREATGVERILWSRLNNRQLGGHKFVRQEPIGPYVADFVCREARLIVELDGGQHADSLRDTVRDDFLVLNGYRVKRFWNDEVRQNLDGVLLTILHLLGGERSEVAEEKSIPSP